MTAGHPIREKKIGKAVGTAAIAWLVSALYYFYQYALRSAPSVMIPQLSDAFGTTAVGVASIASLFYYGYSPFSLVAGAGMDRIGPKKLIPIAAAAVGLGAILFGTGNSTAASIGRLLQGTGGVFALVGAIYIASKYFPASHAATLIGATQMFGMAGGAAGQFAVGPLISRDVSWQNFWLYMGIAGLIMGALLFVLLPKEDKSQSPAGLKTTIAAFSTVFRNPQSIYCGFIAGLLFIPTTIFDMIWGVRYLQEAHGFDYATAVLRSAMVPAGWIIGCPMLGYISDRIGRRKPVIVGGAVVLLGCLSWILFGPGNILPPYVLGLLAGVASGAAMIPYAVIKEANPPQLGGTATGVINFLNFTLSALLAPVFAWRLRRASSGASEMGLAHYQSAFGPLLGGVAIAIVLTFMLKETGPAACVLPLKKVA